MKKIIIIIISIFFLFGIWQSCQGVELILKGQYPEIGGKTLEETSSLAEVIKYIYLFALGAVGIIALLCILIGAIMYVFSVGNPSKASDAKDRIMSALLGILILLAAVLILRTISPDLVDIGFELPGINPTTLVTAEEDYACYCCPRVPPYILSCNPRGTSGERLFCKKITEKQGAEQCEAACKSIHRLGYDWGLWKESCD